MGQAKKAGAIYAQDADEYTTHVAEEPEPEGEQRLPGYVPDHDDRLIGDVLYPQGQGHERGLLCNPYGYVW